MHGLKSAILANFQKSADWLDWPCPPKRLLRIFFALLYFNLIFNSNMKPLSEVATHFFGHSDQNPSSVARVFLNRFIFIATLPKSTRNAVKLLANPKGFPLMSGHTCAPLSNLFRIFFRAPFLGRAIKKL